MRKNLAIIILTAGALLAVFFLTFYIHQTNKRKVLSQFNENQLQIARQTTIQIESYLRSRSHDLRRLSSSAAPQDPDRKRMAADIQSNFKHLKMIQINEISLLDDKGTVSYSTTAVAMGENHSPDNFFSWARDPANKGSVWIGYEKADGRRIPVTSGSPASIHVGIFLVTPLYRESATSGRQKPGGKFAGALMFKVDLEGMLAERSLLFTPQMKLHKLWIMDKDGTLLLQSEHPEMLMRNIREKDETCNQCHASFDHAETMLGKAEGVTEYQLKGGRRKIAAFASMSVGNGSWIVVVNAPLDEVTAFVREDLKETFLLLGLLVFVLGIAFFFAYRNYRERADHETVINTLLSISLLDLTLEEQLSKMFEIIISIPWLTVEATGCIFLVKEKSDVLVMAVPKGLHPSLVTICAEVPFGRCICGRAAMTGETEFADSVDERHDNRYEGISPHGHYCVPIKLHGKVLGVLNLYLRAGHYRDNREEEFLEAITDVMAGVIERKQMDEKLRNSEARYRTIFETSLDGIIIAPSETAAVKYANPSMCRMLGYSAEEMITLSLGDIHPKEALPNVIAEFEAHARGEKMESNDLPCLRKDGTVFSADVRVGLTLVDGVMCNVGVFRDITARKQADEALREGQRQQKAILNNIPDIAWLKDKESRYIAVNEPFGKSCGFEPDALVGKTDLDMWPRDLAERYRADDKEVMESGKCKRVEEPLTNAEGNTLWVETIKTPIYGEDGNVVGSAGIARDITEHKQSEAALLDSMERLRKAFGATIQVLVSAVEVRDPYTSGHQLRSADLARTIATEMGLSQDKIDAIRMAGSIHDIGKLSIPAEILSKPTKLSEIELSLIKEHARRGFEMLKDVESPWPLAEIVYQHHERMDGSGYPRNLKADDILVEARVLAVADVVEAMASHRPYRPGLGIDAALNEIEKNKGIFYDNTVADACLRLFREKGFQLEGT